MDDSAENTVEHAVTIKELEESLEHTNRVLGLDDPDKCTYELGYRTRQAVFACLTCAKDKPAGVCTACVLRCHKNHDVVELWTRRSFRCDCGNLKFGGNKCQLYPDKDSENVKNEYNQNYKGLYCFCQRPFPDPEREGKEEEMSQCVVCEDWFHNEHLGQGVEDEDYDELICPTCVETKCKFLVLYPNIFGHPSEDPEATKVDVSEGDVTTEAAEKQEAGSGTHPPSLPASPSGVSVSSPADAPGGIVKADVGAASDQKGKRKVVEFSGSEEPEESEETEESEELEESKLCKLSGRLNGQSLEEACAAISDSEIKRVVSASAEASEGSKEPSDACDEAAKEGEPDLKKEGSKEIGHNLPPFLLCGRWRESLCTCTDCSRYYEVKGVQFLTEESDTLRAYEALSKQKEKELEAEAEQEMQAKMRAIGPVGQMEVLYATEDLKTNLASFMESFQGTDRVVTASDVHSFFEEFKKKRRRVQGAGNSSEGPSAWRP